MRYEVAEIILELNSIESIDHVGLQESVKTIFQKH
jgi:hypothetical protein